MITSSANPWRTSWSIELADGDGTIELRDRVADLMGVEDEWRVDEEDGFIWWAYQLESHVLITPGENDDGETVYRVECSVVLATVNDVDDDDKVVASMASMTGVGALRFLSDGETIAATTTAYVDRFDEDALRRFALVARTLVYFGEYTAPALASEERGTLAISSHPSAGVRDEPSIQIRLGRYLTAEGLGPSPFTTEHLEEAIESPDHPWLSYKRPSGVHRGVYSLVTTDVELALESFSRPEDVAFVELSILDRHPSYGSAITVLTSYPGLEDVDAVELAAELNDAESNEWTGVPLLGTWWADEANGSLLHVSIIPRNCADEGLFDEVLVAESYRCRWFAQRYELDQGLTDLIEMSGGSEREAAEFILHWRNRPMS